MTAVRMRNSVWKLAAWDPILLWYAKAVGEMQRRPIADPTSWRFQAAIHEYVRQRDPDAQPSDRLPSSGDQKRFWNQCQHGTWFFLPWHRLYLSYFEQIVAATVIALGGPNDWALPYWNYSDAGNPKARSLRPEFFAPTIPGGGVNPLLVSTRKPGNNTGQIIATADDVTSAASPSLIFRPRRQAAEPDSVDRRPASNIAAPGSARSKGRRTARCTTPSAG